MKMDLGMRYDHGAIPSPMRDDEKEHYPSFTYSGKQELELPDEGVMKIRFRKVRSSESKMGDHEMHECTVDVLSIESVKASREEAEDEAPTRKERSTDDALDALAKEHMSEKESY